jgi:hypothetical protein
MMDQEKFIGKYVELLNATVSEAIQKNIVAQAQKAIMEQELLAIKQQIDVIEQEHAQKIAAKMLENNVLKNELNSERQQVGVLRSNVHESNVARQHFETFKNELAQCRQENENLKSLIAEKDEELMKYKPAPKPVVINKLN